MSMYQRRLSIRGKGILSDSQFEVFRKIAAGAPPGSATSVVSHSTARSITNSISISSARQKLSSAPVWNSEEDDDSNSSAEATYSMRGALRVQSTKRSRMESSSNISFSEPGTKKLRPTSERNCEPSTWSIANQSVEQQNVSSVVVENVNSSDLRSENQQSLQNSNTGADALDATREDDTTSVEADTSGQQAVVESEAVPINATENDSLPAQGETQLDSGPNLGCDAEASELDYGDTPMSDPGSEAEEPVNFTGILRVQNLVTPSPNCSARQEPELETSHRTIPVKPLVQISEHMRRFLDSQPEPVNDLDEMNGPEQVEVSESEVSATESETQAADSDFEPENQDAVVAYVDSDMNMFSKLQNAFYCGTHIEVAVKSTPNEAVYFTRSDGHWNLVYPGCYYSQQEHSGHRYGMIEMCAHTIRPFEVLGTRQPMFVWVLKGEVVLKTNAVELMNENGTQVPVLRSFVFKKGDLMVIPGDIPHSLVNKTDEMVRLGFSCFF